MLWREGVNLIGISNFRRKLRKKLKSKKITLKQYKKELDDKKVRYSCIAEMLPNKNFKKGVPLFPRTSVADIDFDILIYDTYDYIDKVISLSLKDPLSAAFHLYNQEHGSDQALAMSNYIKYGTNDEIEIWLLKYGFTFDEIEWILPHVDNISEAEIIFKKSIKEEIKDPVKYEIIERYL